MTQTAYLALKPYLWQVVMAIVGLIVLVVVVTTFVNRTQQQPRSVQINFTYGATPIATVIVPLRQQP